VPSCPRAPSLTHTVWRAEQEKEQPSFVAHTLRLNSSEEWMKGPTHLALRQAVPTPPPRRNGFTLIEGRNSWALTQLGYNPFTPDAAVCQLHLLPAGAETKFFLCTLNKRACSILDTFLLFWCFFLRLAVPYDIYTFPTNTKYPKRNGLDGLTNNHALSFLSHL